MVDTSTIRYTKIVTTVDPDCPGNGLVTHEDVGTVLAAARVRIQEFIRDREKDGFVVVAKFDDDGYMLERRDPNTKLILNSFLIELVDGEPVDTLGGFRLPRWFARAELDQGGDDDDYPAEVPN